MKNDATPSKLVIAVTVSGVTDGLDIVNTAPCNPSLVTLSVFLTFKQ